MNQVVETTQRFRKNTQTSLSFLIKKPKYSIFNEHYINFDVQNHKAKKSKDKITLKITPKNFNLLYIVFYRIKILDLVSYCRCLLRSGSNQI